jgi:hypothetical protein
LEGGYEINSKEGVISLRNAVRCVFIMPTQDYVAPKRWPNHQGAVSKISMQISATH